MYESEENEVSKEIFCSISNGGRMRALTWPVSKKGQKVGLMQKSKKLPAGRRKKKLPGRT